MLLYAHYTFEYAEKHGTLDPGHLALYAGTLDQQSKFMYDSLSRHNKRKDGSTIKCSWRRYGPKCDYGAGQAHGWVAYKQAWALGYIGFTYKDLKRIDRSVELMIFSARVQEFGKYMGFRGRESCQSCKRSKCDYKKRCARVARCAKIPYGTRNGNSYSLCQFVKKYYRIKKTVLELDLNDESCGR
jgi:hypothetical protein